MASVGQVYYDVLPNLDGFAAKVAAGLGSAKPIKIPVEVDSAKAAASLKSVATQTDSLGASSTRLAAAQGRVRVTAAQLAETRQRASAGSSRLIAAEERYAAALRGVKTAQEQDARALTSATAAREKAAARQIAAQEKAAAAAERVATRDAAARRQTIQSAGTGLLVAGAATAAALGGISKVTADFDSAVSGVASTGREAQASIARLREEAIRYGADTAFSATEAANAQAELIKANVSVTDTINGGLKGALDLAAAGSLGVADAAGIMGTALSQFKLPGTDASRVADILAAAAGKAQGEVQDFAEALKYVGPLASSAGVSIEETTGVLAQFANQGILGSQAGTALRGIFLGLTAPVGAGAKAIARYGINVRDAAGNFIGLEGAAGELQKRLGGLGKAERDAALANIFGRQQVTAATVLYNEGAAGVQRWTSAVNDSGFAARTAAIKMDNLRGDIEQLKGALDSAFISAGSGGTEFLRSLAQSATEAIDGFNGLPPAIQEGSFRLAAIAAVAALAAGGVIKIVGAAAAAKTALATLGLTAAATRAKLALLNGPALLAAAGFIATQAAGAALEDQLERNSAGVDGYAESLRKLDLAKLDSQFKDFGGSFALFGQGIDDTTSAFEALKDTQNPVSQGFRRIGDALGTVSTAGILADEFDKLDKSLVSMNPEDAAKAFASLSKQAKAAGLSADQVASTFDDYRRKQDEIGASAATSFRQSEIAFTNLGAGARDLGADLDAVSTALSAIDPNIRRTAQQSTELASSLFAQGDAFQNAISASSSYQAAIDSANEVLDRNGEYLTKSGRALADGSAKGRENIAVLTSLASSGKAYVQSLIQQGAGAEKAANATRRVRGEFVAAARDAGLTEGRAKALADSYGLIPEGVSTTVEAFGLAIQAQRVKDFTAALEQLPPEQRAEIISVFEKDGAVAAQRALERIKDKEVIARAKAIGEKDVQGIDSAIRALKSRLVEAKARGDKKQVDALNAALKAMKSKSVDAKANTYGTAGVLSLGRAVGNLSSKTITITTRRRTVGGGGGVNAGEKADGGVIPAYAGGGVVRGTGGPREDNIALLDRATGVQTAWGSVGEMVVNAAQTMANRSQLEQINSGGKWDIVPRRAGGGMIDGKAAKAVTGGVAARSLTLNLDLGPVFGGVQKLVLDLVDDRDEYSASVGRMG